MPKRSDIITLISITPPIDKTDAEGFVNKPEEVRLSVFGNKKAAWHSEVFKAKQAGYEVRFKLDIRSVDYNSEELVEFEGKRYKVLRIEESISGEFVELTLSDLSERGEANG